jgi:crotonobetainyl-CoA:carnitine CoA-transferase CaiB-like acyl-CoA transferase
MLLGGTTTFTDMYYFEDVVAEAAKEAGMRGVLGETVIGFPVRLNGEPPTVDSPSPTLGQHNELIYGKLLGLSAREIATLQEQGVI